MRSSLSALSSFPIVGPSLFSAEKVVQIAFRDDRCAWGFFFRAYSCLLLSTEYASPPASGPSARRRRWLWKGAIYSSRARLHARTHARSQTEASSFPAAREKKKYEQQKPPFLTVWPYRRCSRTASFPREGAQRTA